MQVVFQATLIFTAPFVLHPLFALVFLLSLDLKPASSPSIVFKISCWPTSSCILPSQDSPGGKRSGPRILSLARDIVENTIKQVNDKRDLSNARLICKVVDKYAAKELFRDVFVSPLEEHVCTWSGISQDNNIRQIPRRAIIHTHSNVESDIERDSFVNIMENTEISEGFEHALAAFPRFPNLDSVEVSFTPECIGDHGTLRWEVVVEDVSRREDILTFIFRAIQDRAADKKNRTIRKLTVFNLQNYPIPRFTFSDLFCEVMGQLKELHISITQEYNERVPDHDYTRIELQTLPAHFCLEWLKPISGNLRALSIYHRADNWGPFPGYVDFSCLHFPKLETLAFGYYTLAHDNDLNWILAIKSLRKLILHNCMIASKIHMNCDNMDQWKVRTHDCARLPNDHQDQWTDRFVYNGKWSQCLDRIVCDLPNLVDFRFDHASPYVYQDGAPRYGLQHRDNCGITMFPKRYICFDNEILPTHWPEAEDDGTLHTWIDEKFPINCHKSSLDEDRKSLTRLLEDLQRYDRKR